MGILPALIIAITISLIIFSLISAYTLKIGRFNLNSISWLKQNKRRTSLFVAFPALLIMVPMTEEIVFRAPLIVLFKEEGTIAWITIAVSAIVFASMHSIDGFFTRRVVATPADQLRSDNLAYEVEKLRTKTSNSKRLQALRVCQFASMTAFGVITGFIAVSQQSLWMVIIIHSIWNLFTMTVLPLLVRTVKTLVVWSAKLARCTFSLISERFKSKLVTPIRTDDPCT